MSIRKLFNLLLCESYYISIYHQRLSANAIVAERSMTSVSTDKMKHKFKHDNEEKKSRFILVFVVVELHRHTLI